jgi:hypothetical protein
MSLFQETDPSPCKQSGLSASPATTPG